MEKYNTSDIPKSSRIPRLVEHLYAEMPKIESARARLLTESYQQTEGEPIIQRRAKAFAHILHHLPIVIREEELIVGSSTLAPRSCQTFPEFSYQWLEDELDTVAESVFSVPGLGRYFVSSISRRDYTMIMGVTIFYSALIVFMNLICDILYKIVDPRIKLD